MSVANVVQRSRLGIVSPEVLASGRPRQQRGTNMGHKVFQEYANCLCQMFVNSPSNVDLVDLAILGPGTLRLDLLGSRALHNDVPVEPIPFMDRWSDWLRQRTRPVNPSGSSLR